MTADQELRDLLTTEADGPTRHPAAWDDIVRRGHHRRRVTRVRNGLALGGLAAVVAVGAVALNDRAGDDGAAVIANDPSTTTTSTTALDPARYGPGITQARAVGVLVTVLTAPSDPASGFDPCVARHPRVTETATEVTVELVDASTSSGSAWAGCQASPVSGWGTIELTDPLGGRSLVDATTGEAISVTDGAPLLFPTELPEPFDLDEWDEIGGAPPAWTFSWTAGDAYVNVTSDPSDALACDATTVDVRGTTGQICLAGSGAVLEWDEGGHRRQIEVGHVSGGTSPFSTRDLVAIADGLEPLGG